MTTKEDIIKSAIEQVEDQLRKRHDFGNINGITDETNFLMGAASAMNAVYGKKFMSMLPASWVFGLIHGDSVIGVGYDE